MKDVPIQNLEVLEKYILHYMFNFMCCYKGNPLEVRNLGGNITLSMDKYGMFFSFSALGGCQQLV